MKNVKTPTKSRLSTVKLVLGVFCIAMALMLCISFISYLNNWQEDQSQLGFMLDKSVKSSNFLGKLGDWLGNVFIFASLGITAFVIPFLLVVLGSILLGIKYFKPWKFISHSLFFACWLPIFIGAITKGNGVISGVYGYQVYDYGIAIIGIFGLWVCIVLSIFIYFVLEFDLSSESISENLQDIKYKISSLKKEEKRESEEKIEKESASEKLEELNDFPEPGSIIPVIKKDPEAVSISFKDDKVEENSIVESILNPDMEELSGGKESDLEVVIEKPKVEEIEQKPTTAEDLVAKHGVYDHRLDLANFQLPNLDLLKDYGSEESIINKEELEAKKNKIVG